MYWSWELCTQFSCTTLTNVHKKEHLLVTSWYRFCCLCWRLQYLKAKPCFDLLPFPLIKLLHCIINANSTLPLSVSNQKPFSVSVDRYLSILNKAFVVKHLQERPMKTHWHVFILAQNTQTKHLLKSGALCEFAETVCSPTHMEGESEQRDVKLVAVCNLTARCH